MSEDAAEPSEVAAPAATGLFPPGTPPVVVLKNVSREFKSSGDASTVRALRKVNLTIARGAQVAIRGPSGSGKSTLLNILGGLDVPTSGKAMVDGKDLGSLSERQLTAYRASTIGFVFQTFNLLPTLSARENVELPMEALGTPKADRRTRSEELLASVGMSKRADHRPGKLSGGEQQRVAIARALANRPAIILADEPTGNLDRRSRNKVLDLLSQIHRDYKTTLIIVTHDPNVANRCERIHLIKYGKFVRDYVPEVRPETEDEGDLAEDDPTNVDRPDEDDEE